MQKVLALCIRGHELKNVSLFREVCFNACLP